MIRIPTNNKVYYNNTTAIVNTSITKYMTFSAIKN